MVMIASSPDGRVEILIPPSGSMPGDRVQLEDQEATKPDIQLKAKVWKAVSAKLRTRKDLVVACEGNALIVPGKGAITTASLAEVPIK